YKSSFQRVFEWIDRLRSSAYYVDVDLDNLEHVFSMAEMMVQTNLAGGEALYSDLRYIIGETIDQTAHLRYQPAESEGPGRPITPPRLLSTQPYSDFFKSLASINNERRKRVNAGAFLNDVIITFNYDVLLECAVQEVTHRLPAYFLAGTAPDPDAYTILK